VRVWVPPAGGVLGADRGEQGVGEHGQGDVGVPGVVAAGLVVVQAGFAFGLLKAALDRTASTRDRDELGQGGGLGPVADVVGERTVVQAAAGQQSVSDAGFAQRADVDRGPVVDSRSFRAVARAQPLPR
jgi:hypothetical protein